ncbi:unnamed protein product [Didymodactylos carnosus]|uniref:NAD(P)-binding domain-containing protein n=1 Tax=Didymodactylos carnosus TaxID=1234261 RepID=A0A8S2RRQ4_9BILA|nr:unnamed protein product [Didymodactylos carnosus]
MVKVALYGASGDIGGAILAELLDRNHVVLSIVRDPRKLDNVKHENLTIVKGDIFDENDVAEKVRGYDAVISAYGPGRREGEHNSTLETYTRLLMKATQLLFAGTAKAGVKRIITVGGAGTLKVKPNVQLMDTDELPREWYHHASAHRDAKKYIENIDTKLDWAILSGSAYIHPGEKTGKFRLGLEDLLRDQDGISHISMGDYAQAIVDELEEGKHIRQRFTVGY